MPASGATDFLQPSETRATQNASLDPPELSPENTMDESVTHQQRDHGRSPIFVDSIVDRDNAGDIPRQYSVHSALLTGSADEVNRHSCHSN